MTVKFDFMRSRYRVTVEQEPGDLGVITGDPSPTPAGTARTEPESFRFHHGGRPATPAIEEASRAALPWSAWVAVCSSVLREAVAADQVTTSCAQAGRADDHEPDWRPGRGGRRGLADKPAVF